MTWTRAAGSPSSSDQPRAPVLGVHDDRVHALVELALGVDLARLGLAREHVVGGDDPRLAVGAQQVLVQRLHRQPLEVHDVGLAARGAQHVGDVHGQARPAPAAPLRSEAVEVLAHRVAPGRGHLAVREGRRDELDVRPRRGQRSAQRPVVRRRIGGGVDDADAHLSGDNRPRGGCRALLLRREHRAARAARALPGRHRGRARDPALRDRGAGPRQRLARRIGGRRAPPRAGARGHRAGPPRGQGRERHRAAQARPRALRAAAQRGLRAAARARCWRCAARWRSARTRRPPARGCCAPTARGQPSAWRFPTPATALVGALFLHKRFTVQSRGERTRTVDWAQSAALLVRTDAAREIEWFDPAFFVYSDEVDFCRRLRDAGWRTLYVPQAVAVHHEQLSTGKVPERRIVELSRNRDRYMRKHHSAAGGRRGARADGVGLRGARARGARAARPRPAALLAPRHRDAAPGSGRGPARGRDRSQPRPAPLGCRPPSSGSPCRPARRPTTASRSCRCPGRWSGRACCRLRSSRAGARRR